MAVCGRTGKQIFSEEEAYRILDRAQYGGRKLKYGRSKRHERRAYECEFCGHWHLTSRK